MTTDKFIALKRNKKKIATDLGYGADIIKKIEESITEDDIYHAMATGREQADDNKNDKKSYRKCSSGAVYFKTM